MTDTLSTLAEGTTNAKSMRWAVLGDIHANLEALQAVLEDARLQQCTAHACVGDVVGYNANPRECLELIRSLDTPCVKGNHDHYAATSEALDNLSPRAAAVLSWTRDQIGDEAKAWLSGLPYVRLVANFSIVHATLDQPSSWGYVFERFAAAASFTYQRTAVCFFGHTHFPMAFLRDPVVRSCTYSKFTLEPGRKYFINVGSVGEPRDGDPRAAYVIYDLEQRTIELRRVAFDLDRVDAKLRDAGLPPRRRA
jgi:predicted phosphodiesterase